MKKTFITAIFTLLCLGVVAQTEITDSIADDTLAADSLAADSTEQELAYPQNIQVRLDKLMREPLLEISQLGLMVFDLDADSVVFAANSRQTLRPASTMKLITAITALDNLGGDYRFNTSLYYDGTIAERTLIGNIYCVGGMDPLFNNDDMNAFVESIVGMEIDTIRGYIVADKSMKDTLRYGEGWCWDDDNYVLSPLLVGREDIFVATLKTRLAEAGICVDEAVDTIGTIPVGTYALCTRTHTLDQVLMPMMKDSKNLYAESMAYQIAAQNGRMKASYKHAKAHMQKLINRIGLRALDYRLADGSGLSLYNYVSAQLLVALLRHAYRNSEIFIHLYPSLPIAGVDGTLAKRMRKSHAFDNVHAKTGTLTGVISLAGYCRAANGHMLAFAILNQGVLNAARARAFQDKVCEALCCP